MIKFGANKGADMWNRRESLCMYDTEGPEKDDASTANVKFRCGVAIIEVDGKGSQNIFNTTTVNTLSSSINIVRVHEDVLAVVVISTKPDSFIAGADIHQLERMETAEEAMEYSRSLQNTFDRLANFSIPVVAAIMGTCMGAGLELALACDYRIAVSTESTKFALTEVRLGLVPGAGGTQRLPQVVALGSALEILLTGRSIDAERAREVGLVDQLMQPVLSANNDFDEPATRKVLADFAVTTALRLACKTMKIGSRLSISERFSRFILSYEFLWNRYVRGPAVAKLRAQHGGHYPAPFAVLRAVEAGFLKGPSCGYEVESKEFARLTQSPESKALIGLYRGVTHCRKQRFGDPAPVKIVGIIGTSEVALGMIISLAGHVHKMIVVEENDKKREKTERSAKKYWNRELTLGRIEKHAYQTIIQSVEYTHSFAELSRVHAAIVALDASTSADNLGDIVTKSEAFMPRTAPIAVYSFGRSLDELADRARNANRIVGLFVTSPVEKADIVELVMHKDIDQVAVATIADLAVRQGKLVFATEDSAVKPGYYVAHCILGALSQLCKLLVDGYLNSARDIDQLTKYAGFHSSISAVADSIGLDAVAEAAERFNDAEPTVSINVDFLIWLSNQEGRSGKNCDKKAGIHSYSYDGYKLAAFDQKFEELLTVFREKKPMSVGEEEETKTSNDEEDEPRLTLQQCAERVIQNVVAMAVHCYRVGMVSSKAEANVASVYGMGFPAYLGGPVYYYDRKTFGHGARTIVH